ncbi:MAG: AI-2E family transporter [Bryobacteraceae bacterium]
MKRSQGFLLALLAIALYLCFLLAKPFLLAIAAAGVLAVVCYPMHRRVLGAVRNRDLAALVSTLAIVVLVVGPTALVSWAAVRELRALYGQHARSDELMSLMERAAAWLGVAAEDLRAEAVERLQQAAAWLVKVGGTAMAEVGGSLVQAVISFVTLYFFLRDGREMLRRASEIVPLPQEQTELLYRRAGDTIVANVWGVVAVAAAQGVLGGFGFWLTGLGSPVLWGIVTAVVSLVPVFGSALVWLPGTILLAAAGRWSGAAFLAIWGAAVVAQADNVIRPMVVSGRMHLNPLFVFFALLGGMNQFGVVGVFIGPVILSVAVALVEFWRESGDGD